MQTRARFRAFVHPGPVAFLRNPGAITAIIDSLGLQAYVQAYAMHWSFLS